MSTPKLSEAILLGSIGTEQGFGGEAMYGSARCAMGAALLAVGIHVYTNLNGIIAISTLWPWTNREVPTPLTVESRGSGSRLAVAGESQCVYSLIWILNDVARWTRPQIAAWVASIEPQDASPVRVPTEVQQEVA